MMLKYVFTTVVLLVLQQHTKAQTLDLQSLWLDGLYRTSHTNIQWYSESIYYTDIHENTATNDYSLSLYSAQGEEIRKLTFPIRSLLPSQTHINHSIIAPDQASLLFAIEEEAIYRRSSKAYYYLYQIATKQLIPLHDFALGKISYPEFSPDGKYIAYVRNNNLYAVHTSSLQEQALTTDGAINRIINGATDWVYEEEFEFAKAFFWSADSKKIAYYRFDESKVKEYTMQYWDSLYPFNYVYKYPKAGEANSSIQIRCAFLETSQNVLILSSIPNTREYIPRLQWTGQPDVLSIQCLNRLQNKLEILHYDVVQKKSQLVYEETDKAYIELNDKLHYLAGTEDFFFTSERSGFRHLYRFSKNTLQVTALTKGSYEVSEICGIDLRHKTVFYTAQEISPVEKHLYQIDFLGKKKKQLTTERGWHEVAFSPQMHYYTSTFSRLDRAPTTVLKESSTGKTLRILTNNHELNHRLDAHSWKAPEFFSFTTEENILLDAWMIKPKDFSPERSYPVLLAIYGGPGSQKATQAWGGYNYLWYRILAEKGYIVVCVDGRGTGGRGASFKKCTQHQLGNYETEDLIQTARYLQKQPYIDKARIGIFGWSYGGYLSSLAITKGADVFKTSIAVAPVTNWRYYDNIYTERYMGLPEDNAQGYDENAPIHYADRLKGNYLLIHGTADDNVHLQNALEMQRALIKANKQFELFYYPDKNHGIYGGNTRYHLYQMMTDFILRKL
jgi:dipeptidyl-peptidase-4